MDMEMEMKDQLENGNESIFKNWKEKSIYKLEIEVQLEMGNENPI